MAVLVLLLAACDDASTFSYAELAERAATHERLYPGPCTRTWTTDGDSLRTETYQYDDAGHMTHSIATSPPQPDTSETTATYDENGDLVRTSIVQNGETTTLVVYTRLNAVERRGETYANTDTPIGEPVSVVIDALTADGTLSVSTVFNDPPFDTASRVTNYQYADGHLTSKVTMALVEDGAELVQKETWEYTSDGLVATHTSEDRQSTKVTTYTYSTVETDLTRGSFVFVGGGETLATGEDVYDAFGNLLMRRYSESGMTSEFQDTYECF